VGRSQGAVSSKNRRVEKIPAGLEQWGDGEQGEIVKGEKRVL